MTEIILTDLDHTLLRQDGSISENTLRVITKCREQGILFAIATARYRIGAEKYIDMLCPDYEITTDGTLIHSGGECIYSCSFDAQKTNMIVRSILAAVPQAEITVAGGKTVYWNSMHIAESERLHKAVYNDYSSYFDVCGNKIAAVLPDEGIARDIAGKMQCRLQCYREEKLYAFLPYGSGKTTAVRALARFSGIALDNITAFGDDDNDLEMLRMCGRGIAVANAVPAVLKAADEVTLSNDEDGVAHWLEENCLQLQM